MKAFLGTNEPLESIARMTEPGGPVHLPYQPGENPAHERASKIGKAITAAFAIALAIFFCGAAAIGVVSARIANDSVALFTSPDCGDWRPAGRFNLSTLNSPEYDREERSAVYKDTCYGPGAKVENCNLFITQSLDYEKSDAGCPFDGDASHFGRSDTSIHFDTGLIDISKLGFNAPAKQRLEFRRNMTCAPLLMDDRFIRIGHLPGGKTQWEYYYGKRSVSTDKAKYLWKTPDHENGLLGPGYDMMSFTYHPWSSINAFMPLPEFRAGAQDVSIFFITSSQKTYHPNERSEPIFPAHYNMPKTSPIDLSAWWINNSTKATVLGCVDGHQVCDMSENKCWGDADLPLTETQRSFEGQTLGIYNVLLSIMPLSNAHGAVSFRLAAGLDAQRKAGRGFSLPLAEEQWKVEAEEMFKASLAAFQLGFYDFARGTYANIPGYARTTEAQAACGSIKINSIGWKNVDAVLFWGILALCFVVFLFSRRHGSDRRTRETRPDGSPPDGKKFDRYDGQLWVEILGRFTVMVCWRFCVFVDAKISPHKDAIRSAWAKFWNSLADVNEWIMKSLRRFVTRSQNQQPRVIGLEAEGQEEGRREE